MSMWGLAAEALTAAGVTHVFGLPADEPGLLDAADAHPGLVAVPVRDQRAGACAAAGFAAAGGAPPVLALTSGPAFTNALTGLLEAASIGLPVVVVTTRIPAAELGRGGFQELDQRAMAAPLVKAFTRVELADRLAWALERAVHLAVNGRPGVTLVEVTHEVLGQSAPPYRPGPAVRRLRSMPAEADLARAADILADARRPVVLAGGGARHAAAGPQVASLAEALGAAMFTTASGRGVVDEDHPMSCGVAGLYLTPPVDRVIAAADVVVVVGSRLEETARTGWPEPVGQRIVQIDADPTAFGQAVSAEVALLGDAALTAAALADRLAARDRAASAGWGARVRAARGEALAGAGSTGLRAVLAAVPTVFGSELTLVQENGLHDIWGYHFAALRATTGTLLVTPGEQTMMGFGLPAAYGAALAHPGRPTVLICGDGAFGAAATLLPTIAERGIGLVVVVADNGGFGWPRRGRASIGADETLTRFGVAFPAVATVTALGGTALTVGGDPVETLSAARAAAARGRIALVVVPVDDADIPPGVARLEEPA
jgi:acetolactate synthase-1/2/3 large subunit